MSCRSSRCFPQPGSHDLDRLASTNYSTETIVTHLTDVGTVRFEMGYAAAISVFLFALMAVTRVLVGKLLDMAGR